MASNKFRRLLFAFVCAGAPFIATASCDPYGGTLTLFRQQDDHHYGFFDFFIEGLFYDDCCHGDCWLGDCYYDDYSYEEIIFFD